MRINNKKVFLIIALFLILFLLLYFALKQTATLHRDPQVLINRYYLLKKQHPQQARQALTIILAQNSQHLLALKELSQLYIQEENWQKALPLLQRIHRLAPDDYASTLQLAQAYQYSGLWEKAYVLLLGINEHAINAAQQQQIHMLLKEMDSSLPHYRNQASITYPATNTTAEVPTLLLNFYYSLKRKTQLKAINYYNY